MSAKLWKQLNLFLSTRTLPKTNNDFAPENRPAPKRKGFLGGTRHFFRACTASLGSVSVLFVFFVFHRVLYMFQPASLGSKVTKIWWVWMTSTRVHNSVDTSNVSMFFISLFEWNHDTNSNVKNTKLYTNRKENKKNPFQTYSTASYTFVPTTGLAITVTIQASESLAISYGFWMATFWGFSKGVGSKKRKTSLSSSLYFSSWWLNHPFQKTCSSNDRSFPQVGVRIEDVWSQHRVFYDSLEVLPSLALNPTEFPGIYPPQAEACKSPFFGFHAFIWGGPYVSKTIKTHTKAPLICYAKTGRTAWCSRQWLRVWRH